ncbi:MAG: hypothetical protein ACQ9MH_12650 [Nitrospinales bacterium]
MKVFRFIYRLIDLAFNMEEPPAAVHLNFKNIYSKLSAEQHFNRANFDLKIPAQ